MNRRTRLLLLASMSLAVAAFAIGGAATALADDSLSSSSDPSTRGEAVTFTASFTPYCADGANVTFTVDGDSVAPDAVSVSGTSGTASLTISSLSTGAHTIAFRWTAGVPPDPTCGGGASLLQTVVDQPATPPEPPPSAPATAEPSASPPAPASSSPSTAASSPRGVLTASSLAAPAPALVGLLVLVLLGGAIGTALARRR